MLTLDVLPHFLQKILARRIDFGLTINLTFVLICAAQYFSAERCP
jgi:hypothetical protein